jgi:phospholipid/cholesterol/gamma-HCH transport system ATP-binding protein
MRLFTEDTSSGHYTNAQFQLHSGQLALARFNDLRQIGAFADAFSGLRIPSQGRVRFYGRDWQEVTPDVANAMRGKIGRVFSSVSWLDGFTVSENILLSQLHHTRRATDAIRQEAAHWSVHFGLPGLPIAAPNAYSRVDLQRAACARAFMGRPDLLLLEDPTFGIYPAVIPALVNAIRNVRNHGAAVWWMTLSNDIWMDDSIPADRHFRLSGRKLIEMDR